MSAASANKKKTGSKNRRDAHGVYERRSQRGKVHFSNEADARSKRKGGKRAGSEPGGLNKRGIMRGSSQKTHSTSKGAAGFERNSSVLKYKEELIGEINENMTDIKTLIIGRNPVIEALRNNREIEKIYMAAGAEGSVVKIRAKAKDAGVPVDTVPRIVLDKMTNNGKHQGVIAEVSKYSYSSVEDMLCEAARRGEEPFIVILDGINDPHNLGAVIRTAECAGAHGIIIPKRNACGLTAAVAKTSAGALETMPVARVANIAGAIEKLRDKGIWVFAVDMDGTAYYKKDLSGPVAIVIGSEGKGIGRLVKERCDLCVSIPMSGRVGSLNASNAAAIVMYEIRRTRDL